MTVRLHTVALRETTVTTLCLAAVAIHVAYDSFIQLQPGTSAGDHVVCGLLPLALLALAAAASRRCRGARRAAVAFAAGVFGIVAGIEAAYYTMNGGPSGDDYTGIVALAAGIILITVGGLTLWRTRRMDGSRRRHYLRRSLMCGATAILGL